jgi:hypothetical protein
MEAADPTPGTRQLLERRALVALVSRGLLAAPRAAGAQQAGRSGGSGIYPHLDGPTVDHAAFQEKLRDLGWLEGKNILIESRYAVRDLERMAVLAADVVHLPVDLTFTTGDVESTQAAKIATSAMIEVWKPGDAPKRRTSVVVPFHQRVPPEAEAEAVALQAAKRWIDRE